jgi:hypothetical protein
MAPGLLFMKGKVKEAWLRFRRACFWVFSRGSVVLVLAAGVYLTPKFLYDPSRDTTMLTNSGFAILASMAGLAFSWSRAIQSPGAEGLRDRVCFAGERFLHAAILMILASTLKYAAIVDSTSSTVVEAIQFVLGTVVGCLFFWAMITAHTGLRIVNEILWSRMARHSDWDNLL